MFRDVFRSCSNHLGDPGVCLHYLWCRGRRGVVAYMYACVGNAHKQKRECFYRPDQTDIPSIQLKQTLGCTSRDSMNTYRSRLLWQLRLTMSFPCAAAWQDRFCYADQGMVHTVWTPKVCSFGPQTSVTVLKVRCTDICCHWQQKTKADTSRETYFMKSEHKIGGLASFMYLNNAGISEMSFS